MKRHIKNQPEEIPLGPIIPSNTLGLQIHADIDKTDTTGCETFRPDSPDSTTPLKKNKSKMGNFLKPINMLNMSGLNLSENNISRDRISMISNNKKEKENIWINDKLKIIKYYFNLFWNLLKRASSRTMSLPIAYSSNIYTERSDVARPILIGNSLNLFSPNNKIRRFLAFLLRSEIFEVFLTLVIFAHFLILATTSWQPDSRDKKGKSVRLKDNILIAVFVLYTIEALFRIIVGGLIHDGIKYPKKTKQYTLNTNLELHKRIYSLRSAYLRKSFNRLDLFCIICYWIFNSVSIFATTSIEYSIIAALSSLRIFRLLNFFSSSQVILKSLKTSGPLLTNVFLMIAFFMVGFSIIGTTFFKDSLKNQCFMLDDNNNPETESTKFNRICGSFFKNGTDPDELILEFPLDEKSPFKRERSSFGYTCPLDQICKQDKNPNNGQTSFDDLFRSFIYVFIIGTGQSWSDIMYSIFYGTNSGAALYFITLIVALNFWLLNMFIAVINQVFSNLRSNHQNEIFKKRNIDLIDTNLKHHYEPVYNEPLINESRTPTTPMFKKKSYFNKCTMLLINEWFWIILIIINLGVLGSKTNRSSNFAVRILEIIELVINILFVFEILIRYFIQSTKGTFFSKSINTFDTLISIINLVNTLINVIQPNIVYKYLTLFQVVRFYKIAWKLPNVRKLLNKIGNGISSIGNMTLFVFTLMFLCSAIAIQLFGGIIPLKDGNDEIFQRFDSFGWAFLALYQVFSGEDWSTVLFNLLKAKEDILFSIVSVIFIFTFFALSNFILLNLFIAVLVENLELSDQQKKKIQLENYFLGLQNDIQRIGSYLSPWNIYKYIKPDPQKIKVNGISDKLLLDLKTFDTEQFLKLYKSKDKDIKYKSNLIEKFETFNLKRNNQSIDIKHKNQLSLNEESAQDRLLSFIQYNEKEEDQHHSNLYDQINLQREEFMEVHPTYDKTLFLFSKHSKIRRFCQIFTNSPDHPNFPFTPFSLTWFINKFYFAFIIIAVIVNVVFTISQTPQLISCSKDSISLYKFSDGVSFTILQTPQLLACSIDTINLFKFSDGIFLIIFSADVLIYIISDGLLLTPNAYLSNFWNVPYFIALIISFIDFFASFTTAEGLSRFARAGKALRVLRLINFSKTAKFTLDAVLVSGFPKLFDAGLIAMCFLIPWSIYLQNIFRGLLYSCNDEDVNNVSECIGEYFNEDLGITVPRVWSNPYKYSFDNFGTSLNILFQITSGEGWTDVMKKAMTVTNVDLQLKSYSSWYHSLIFISFNFIVSVSVLSLFVSVIIDNFTTRSGSALLSSEQRRWKDFSKILKSIAPPKLRQTKPKFKIVDYFHQLATTKKTWFTKVMGCIYFCIFIVLATERSGMTVYELYIKTFIQLALVSICLMEILIRAIGLKPLVYFKNIWNALYFLLVIISLMLCLARLSDIGFRFTHNLLNFTLILISLRLMSMFDGLLQLFQTLKASAKNILNLFFVWIILFLVYAIIFIQVFGNTKVGPSGSEDYVNFYNPSNALLMLVRFSQGEGWNSVMYDFTIQTPNCVIDNKSDFLSSDCGSPGWSYFLFMSFNILSMYIFLNMFIGVIVDNFSFCYEISNDGDEATTSDMLSRDQIRLYKMAWIQFDPKRTQYISPNKILPFLLRLKLPFECKIYNKIYSISNLVECGMFNNPTIKDKDKDTNAYGNESLNLTIINSLLRTMNPTETKIKQKRLNSLYHELRLLVKPNKGVHFSDALLVLSREFLIDPLSSFEIKDLIKFNKMKEEVQFQIYMEKVVGILHTFILRRKFLNHLQLKKQRETMKTPKLNIQTEDLEVVVNDSPNLSPLSPLSHHHSNSFNSFSGSMSDLSVLSSEDMDQDTAKKYLDQLNNVKWKDALKKNN